MMGEAATRTSSATRRPFHKKFMRVRMLLNKVEVKWISGAKNAGPAVRCLTLVSRRSRR